MVDLKKCPEFQNGGCPFKSTSTVKEFTAELSKVPTSHREGLAYKTLIEVLRAFIAETKRMEKEVGQCTAFQGGCPFMSIKLSDGKPLQIPPEKLR